MQTQLNFQPITHLREKDSDGTKFVIDNKEKLNKECFKVLELLMRGLRLNNAECILNRTTGSLSSRISELRKIGIIVSKEWTQERSYKEYFLTDEEIKRVALLVRLSK